MNERRLRDDYADVRFRPKLVWNVVSDVTQFVGRGAPEHAYHILCIKDAGLE